MYFSNKFDYDGGGGNDADYGDDDDGDDDDDDGGPGWPGLQGTGLKFTALKHSEMHLS